MSDSHGEDVGERIAQIIGEFLPSGKTFDGESRLVEDLGFDSVTLLELSIAIEDAFDTPTLEAASQKGIRTVGDIERVVCELRLARGGA